MIAIDPYRARIGCFFSKSRRKIKSRRRSFSRGCTQTHFPLTEFIQTCILFLFIITLRWNITVTFAPNLAKKISTNFYYMSLLF